MVKPRTLTISGPFDARHVGGVTIPGVTIPVAGPPNSTTATSLEPDEAPSHTFVAQGNIEAPRRSNTFASSLSRPALRLRTSISMLRGHSSPISREATPEPGDGKMQGDIAVASLRNKSSSSRLWTRSTQEAHKASPVQSLRKKPSSSALWNSKRPGQEAVKKDTAASRSPPHTSRAADRDLSAVTLTHSPLETDAFFTSKFSGGSPPRRNSSTKINTATTTTITIIAKPSISSQPSQSSSTSNANPYSYNPSAPPGPVPPKALTPPPSNTHRSPSQKNSKRLPVRPKRADSGVAVEHHEAPAQERPLGFKEILAVPSFEERMKLYKRMRDYWAQLDNGLDDWMVKRPVGVKG